MPPLRYDLVRQLARDFPSIRITLNGGISSFADVQKIRNEFVDSSLDGVMAGRWVLKRPLDMRLLDSDALFSHWVRGSIGSFREVEAQQVHSLVEVIQLYGAYASREVVEGALLSETVLPLLLVTEQLKDDFSSYSADTDTQLDEALVVEPVMIALTCLDYSELWDIFEVVYDTMLTITSIASPSSYRMLSGVPYKQYESESPPFRKLSSVFKSILGTKVVNKVLRNRAE